MPRVKVNYETCLKTGQCYYLHPEIFRARDDDFPESVAPTFGEELREAMEDAAELCPTSSLLVANDD